MNALLDVIAEHDESSHKDLHFRNGLSTMTMLAQLQEVGLQREKERKMVRGCG
ncbi:hypothetical protein SESBI_46313 [Sesbania bispinosa]|nr:hypothetical protein SESBI_46313 [Sesbania bispinosa]